MPFTNGTRYLGGTQDNGTILGGEAAGEEGWRLIFGGDGAYAAVAGEGATIYAQSQFSNLVRSTDGGIRWFGARNGLDPPRFSVLRADSNFLFITPLAMDPANAQRLWIGGEYLYRSDNGASLWSRASTRLPDAVLVSAISVSPADGNRVAAGSTRGDVLVSTAALQASASTEWQVSLPREGWVTSVTHDPIRPRLAPA